MMLTLDTNLKAANATTQYTNFNFNSFVNFNGVTLAAGSGGIFSLDGDTDNGVSIDAYFEPVVSDIGVIRAKRMRYLYTELRLHGSLDIEIAVDEGSSQTYRVTDTDMKAKRHRTTISKALHGTYWLYQFKNVNGADFSIDTASGVFIFRNQGVMQG
jgi:hypothetical protein